MTADCRCKLVEQIESVWPPDRWVGFNVLVAVSGGADSVALLRALVEIRQLATNHDSGSLIVAHYNHQLRGVESDRDAEFVSQLAAALDLSFFGTSAPPSVEASSENDFREERYEFLFDVARQTNSRYIVTAHHRDDQVETVLFRLFRGTGVAGLGGIPASRVVDESLTIVRPMLGVCKEEIEAALESWQQKWRDDSSNSESNYTRNFIRNDVLPDLRKRFDSVDESISRLALQAVEQQAFLHDQAVRLFDAVSEVDELTIVDCQKLKDQSPVLLRELFIEIFRRKSWPTSQLGFGELNRLAQLVASEIDEPRFQLPGAVSCEKRLHTMKLYRS